MKNAESNAQTKWTTKAWGPSKTNSLKKVLRKNTTKGDGNIGTTKNGAAGVDHGESVIFASNREPYWLEQISAYSLDFQGRVTLPSNKNFQLVTRDRPNEVILQFGKVVSSSGGHMEIYTLDLQWPFSPLQAFGIC